MSTPAANLTAPQAETTPLRFVTAASLFDGHDAAINIMRRLIQAQGAEVVHLGHNRSVEDLPAPPVPVMPMTGVLPPASCHSLRRRESSASA